MRHYSLYTLWGLLLVGTSLIASEVVQEASESDVRKHIVGQFRELDFILEHVGQAIHANAAKVGDKKEAVAHIISLRQALGQELESQESKNVFSLLGANRAITDRIAASIESHFSCRKMDTPLDLAITGAISEVGHPDMDSIEAELLHRSTRIGLFKSYVEIMGLSLLNRAARAAAEFDKAVNVSGLLKRALPYAGLAAYYYTAIKEYELPAGHPDRPQPVAPPVPLPEVDLNAPNALPELLKRILDKLPEEKKDKDEVTDIRKKSPVDGFLGSFLSYFFIHDKRKPRRTLVNAYLGNVDSLCAIELTPALTLSPLALFAPVLKEDATDLYGCVSHCMGRAASYCKGEPWDDGTGYKKSTAKFSDVVGAHRAKAELGRIVDYFKDKGAIDRTGASVDRSFLLVGPLDTAKSLARAVAGEVSAVLKEQNKGECLVLEIHASSLVSKSIKDVLKEAEKRRTPCVIVLDEIDSLHEMKSVKPEIWSDLISAMNGFARSKKDLFIITTATKDAFAPHTSVDRYGVYCRVVNPTKEDRSHYFAQELERRAIPSSSFNLDILAQKSADCTFTQLTAMLKRALARSQSLGESLTQERLEKSITEVMSTLNRLQV